MEMEILPAKRLPGRPKNTDYRTTRWDDAIVLFATGNTWEQVSEELGIDPAVIRKWMRDPLFREDLNFLRRDIALQVFLAINAHASNALATLVELSQSAKSEGVRGKAAKDIMDLWSQHAIRLQDEERERAKSEELRQALAELAYSGECRELPDDLPPLDDGSDTADDDGPYCSIPQPVIDAA